MATLKQLGYPVDIVLGADATLVLVSPFCNADDIERTGRNLKSAGHPFIDAEPGAGRWRDEAGPCADVGEELQVVS